MSFKQNDPHQILLNRIFLGLFQLVNAYLNEGDKVLRML